MFDLIESTFSEESFTTSVVLPCAWVPFNLYPDSLVFCSSSLFIFADAASSIMIILPWKSIPCNFSNSFCTCSGITAKPKPLFFSFFTVVKSTQQFPRKHVVTLKPKSLIRYCSLTSLLRMPIYSLFFWFTFLIMVTVLLLTGFLIFNIWTWCCDWLLYSWFAFYLKMIFLFSWFPSFSGESWYDALFSACCGGWLKGRFSRTAVWVSIKVWIFFFFGTKLILQELYVVLDNFLRLSFKVWNSLIKGFHKAINFVMQGW